MDAYNLTVQHQLTNTMSMELAFVGNNGHGFYANNPDVNVNQPTIVGFADDEFPGRAETLLQQVRLDAGHFLLRQ